MVVMAAAVADFRPVSAADDKIKKHNGPPQVDLEATEDILLGLGHQKRPGQVIVGFAAETTDVEANAAAKLKNKKADLIVSNDVSAADAGFEHDTNAVTVHTPDGATRQMSLRSKRDVARGVLDIVAEIRNQF